MKIAFLIHSLCIGGAETISVEYLLKLRELGHDVVLVEYYHTESFLSERLKQAGIPIITLQNARGGIVSKLKRKIWGDTIGSRLNKVLKNNIFDILHIHTDLSCLGKLSFDLTRTYYSFHTGVERNLNVLGKKHRKNMFRFAKQGMNFFVLSKQMKSDAEKILPTDRIYLLPNGVDFERIRGQVCDRKELLNSLGLPEEAFVICHVARMHPVKNHLRTIEVFQKVLDKKPNAYLLFVGAVEPRLFEQAKSRISQYQLTERVKFLGSRKDGTAIMSGCDAMILPSFTEGFPLVALEAQVLGVRSVLSDAVPDEIVCNDTCFRLSLQESSEKWADFLVGNFVEKHSHAIREFDISRIVQKLIGYYNRSDNLRQEI